LSSISGDDITVRERRKERRGLARSDPLAAAQASLLRDEFVAVLIEGYRQDADPRIRAEVVKAFRLTPNDSAAIRAVLRDALVDPAESVRHEATSILTAQGRGARPKLSFEDARLALLASITSGWLGARRRGPSAECVRRGRSRLCHRAPAVNEHRSRPAGPSLGGARNRGDRARLTSETALSGSVCWWREHARIGSCPLTPRQWRRRC
jgi:hypothetical protein